MLLKTHTDAIPTDAGRNSNKFHCDLMNYDDSVYLNDSKKKRNNNQIDDHIVNNEGSSHYSINDFNLLRVIGRGSYAKVLMVELKKTKRIYAMKVIKKSLVKEDEDFGWFYIL